MDRILGEARVALRFAENKRDAYFIAIIFGAYALTVSTALILKVSLSGPAAPVEAQNIVLIVVLLVSRTDRQWICLLAALIAHAVVTRVFGEPALHAVTTFIPNALLSVLSARAIRSLLEKPPWLSDFRKTLLFIFVIGFIIPAIVGAASATLHIPIQLSSTLFLDSWLNFFINNSLTNLTFLPLALMLTTNNPRAEWQEVREHAFEVALLVAGLILLCAIVSSGVSYTRSGLLPLMIYAPGPFILWITARFGIKGSAIAIAALGLISVFQIPSVTNLSIGGSPANGAAVLHILLISITIPFLLLGASVDQARRTATIARDNEDRMAFVLSATDNVVWQLNFEEDQFWCTDRCAELFGIESTDGISVDKLLGAIHPADRIRVQRVIRHAPHVKQDRSTEFRVRLPSGEIRWLIVRSRGLFRENGHLHLINGIFSDVTSRKRTEEEINTQRMQLAHGMRVAQISALSAGLAHELTQPLTSILANSQAAHAILNSYRPNLQEIASILDDIIEDNSRAATVITRLRSLLRKDSGGFASVDLNQLTISTIELTRNEIVTQQILIEKNLDPILPTIFGDSAQLQQVLLNFLTNGIDALHDLPRQRRKIIVSTRLCGQSEVEFSIADLGSGVAEDLEKQIFDPFFTTKKHGLGLGLSICSTIIKRHAGTLGIRKNPNHGVTVWFRLPLKPRET
jgi:PAS domain S-box-containing protein